MTMAMTPGQEKMLTEVHQALVGNPEFKQPGLIAEHHEHKLMCKEKFDEIDRKLWYYAGACSGAMFIFGAIFTVLQSLSK